jgi:hypothetical protein
MGRVAQWHIGTDGNSANLRPARRLVIEAVVSIRSHR